MTNGPQGISVEYVDRGQSERANPVQYGRSEGTGLGLSFLLAGQVEATGVVPLVGVQIALDPTRWPDDGLFRLRAVARLSDAAFVGNIYLQLPTGERIQNAELELTGTTDAQILTTGYLEVRDEPGFIRSTAQVYEVVAELTGGALASDTLVVGQVSFLID